MESRANGTHRYVNNQIIFTRNLKIELLSTFSWVFFIWMLLSMDQFGFTLFILKLWPIEKMDLS